jgi:uncharacterized RDD family membrane protein YckC
MSGVLRQLLLLAALSCAATFGTRALAQQEPQAPATAQTPATPEAPAAAEEAQVEQPTGEPPLIRVRDEHGENVLVHMGHDSHLRANEAANAVVSIFGSATSEGHVDDAVISVFGNTRVTGPVGGTAIAVFGDNYINSPVHEDAVAVFGNLELGPNAQIDGDAVVIGGTIIRDPAAVVHGDVSEVAFGQSLGRLDWLRPWFEHCLMYGRPLAIAPGLGWAWGLAFVFFALYVLIALLFSRTVEQCVETLETHPGQSVLAAVLSVLLTPPLLMLLVITVIGIALVPLLALALFCAAMFGKAVILAALGRRITKLTGVESLNHIVVATVIGGLLVLGIYLLPVLGFIAQNIIGVLGLGVVVYTILLALRARQAAAAEAAPLLQPAAAGAAMSAGSAGPDAQVSAPMNAAMNPGATAGATIGEPSAASEGAAPAATAAAATPAEALAATAPRAGFWIRMGALLIDIVLVAIVVNILDGDVLPVALAVYAAVMWKLRATTIGGIICGLKIVRLDGHALTWDTTIVRALSCFLSLLFVGLGFFWIAFDKERQAWHDKIAGTVVVRHSRSLV